MTKSELVRKVAKKKKLSIAFCDEIVDAIADELWDCFVAGDNFMIKNFMSFEVREYPECKRRNPLTNKIELFPPRKAVKCKISTALKNAVNGK